MEKLINICHEKGCVNPIEFIDTNAHRGYCGEHWRARLTAVPHQQDAAPNSVENHPSAPHKISKESLIAMRKRLNEKADSLLLAKGNDYNAQQQDAGDTLFNLRICAILGIVPSPVDGILVRMSDKLARLVSLTRPTTVQKVKDESLEDTIVDLRNYADYLLAMVKESKGQEIK